MPLSDQLKQLVELHKAAEQAMKGFIVRMWPGDALPNSYFGLVRRLVDACPWLEVIKRSICIEGARWAFAHAKVHWDKMDAVGNSHGRGTDEKDQTTPKGPISQRYAPFRFIWFCPYGNNTSCCSLATSIPLDVEKVNKRRIVISHETV